MKTLRAFLLGFLCFRSLGYAGDSNLPSEPFDYVKHAITIIHDIYSEQDRMQKSLAHAVSDNVKYLEVLDSSSAGMSQLLKICQSQLKSFTDSNDRMIQFSASSLTISIIALQNDYQQLSDISSDFLNAAQGSGPKIGDIYKRLGTLKVRINSDWTVYAKTAGSVVEATLIKDMPTDLTDLAKNGNKQITELRITHRERISLDGMLRQDFGDQLSNDRKLPFDLLPANEIKNFLSDSWADEG